MARIVLCKSACPDHPAELTERPCNFALLFYFSVILRNNVLYLVMLSVFSVLVVSLSPKVTSMKFKAEKVLV